MYVSAISRKCRTGVCLLACVLSHTLVVHHFWLSSAPCRKFTLRCITFLDISPIIIIQSEFAICVGFVRHLILMAGSKKSSYPINNSEKISSVLIHCEYELIGAYTIYALIVQIKSLIKVSFSVFFSYHYLKRHSMF